MFPKKLHNKLEARKLTNALRQLETPADLADFSSNDYLGFSKSKVIFNRTHKFLIDNGIQNNGSSGSRLLSGNHVLYDIVESWLCDFHKSKSALIFNSGYDANVGLFSSVPQRDDVIFYDEYIHASIRDGIKLSNAKSYKFKHNNLKDLERHLKRCIKDKQAPNKHQNIYIVTESIFSMDGDSPDLKIMVQLCKAYHALLIVDEAHALGVFNKNGAGLLQDLKIEQEVFARIITFGKALGTHGAAILGSKFLKQYLINFARSFIYTTALPPHTLANIHAAYNELTTTNKREHLYTNISHFKNELIKNRLEHIFIESRSAIHCCIIPGNSLVKQLALKLKENGFNVKPILSPTVPKGEERLRFCLHAFNTPEEISEVLNLLAIFVEA